MLKVALYARYSTDNQSIASIEDQFRVCHEHAGKERLVALYARKGKDWHFCRAGSA